MTGEEKKVITGAKYVLEELRLHVGDLKRSNTPMGVIGQELIRGRLVVELYVIGDAITNISVTHDFDTETVVFYDEIPDDMQDEIRRKSGLDLTFSWRYSERLIKDLE